MSGIATPTKDGKVFSDFDDVLPRISSDQNCFQLVRCCKITILPLFYQWKQPTISQICHDFSNLSIRFLLGDIPGSQKAPGGPRGPQGAPGGPRLHELRFSGLASSHAQTLGLALADAAQRSSLQRLRLEECRITAEERRGWRGWRGWRGVCRK